jgi:hypothetical protein
MLIYSYAILFISLHRHLLLVRLHRLSCSLLNVVPGIRPPRSAHLILRHWRRNLLDVNKLLYPHDLASNGLCDGMVDGRHAFAEAESFENTLSLQGHTDAGAHEGYSEVRHGVVCVQEESRCVRDKWVGWCLMGVVRNVAPGWKRLCRCQLGVCR